MPPSALCHSKKALIYTIRPEKNIAFKSETGWHFKPPHNLRQWRSMPKSLWDLPLMQLMACCQPNTTFELNNQTEKLSLQLHQKINGLVTAANERARRRELLLGFSNSPSDFINGLISTQARDLRAQKAGSQALALRRTQFFDGRHASCP